MTQKRSWEPRGCPARYYGTGGLHFITCSGYKRQPLLVFCPAHLPNNNVTFAQGTARLEECA